MRTISLGLLRDAVADAGDWQTLALTIVADKRTAGWPDVVVRDLFRIGTSGISTDVDIAKLNTCLARLEAAHA